MAKDAAPTLDAGSAQPTAPTQAPTAPASAPSVANRFRSGAQIVPLPNAPESQESQSFADLAKELGFNEDGTPLVEADDDELIEGNDDEETPEGDGTDEGAEGAEEDGEESTAALKKHWGAILAAEPHRWSEAPGRIRGESFVESHRIAQERATEQAKAKDEQWGRWIATRDAALADVAKIDAQRADDPDGFLAWETANPAIAARYHAIKNGEFNLPMPPPALAVGGVSFHRVLSSRGGRAAEVAQALVDRQKAEPNRYGADERGFAQLINDALDELLRDGGKTPSDPAKKAAQTRQSSAEARSGLPKPPVGGAKSGGEGALTFESLQAMSQSQVMAYMARPGGEAEIERVLAKGPRK